jgi:hypothetical protein
MANLTLLEVANRCAAVTQGLGIGLNELMGSFGASDPRIAWQGQSTPIVV